MATYRNAAFEHAIKGHLSLVRKVIAIAVLAMILGATIAAIWTFGAFLHVQVTAAQALQVPQIKRMTDVWLGGSLVRISHCAHVPLSDYFCLDSCAHTYTYLPDIQMVDLTLNALITFDFARARSDNGVAPSIGRSKSNRVLLTLIYLTIRNGLLITTVAVSGIILFQLYGGAWISTTISILSRFASVTRK